MDAKSRSVEHCRSTQLQHIQVGGTLQAYSAPAHTGRWNTVGLLSSSTFKLVEYCRSAQLIYTGMHGGQETERERQGEAGERKRDNGGQSALDDGLSAIEEWLMQACMLMHMHTTQCKAYTHTSNARTHILCVHGNTQRVLYTLSLCAHACMNACTARAARCSKACPLPCGGRAQESRLATPRPHRSSTKCNIHTQGNAVTHNLFGQQWFACWNVNTPFCCSFTEAVGAKEFLGRCLVDVAPITRQEGQPHTQWYHLGKVSCWCWHGACSIASMMCVWRG